MKTTSKKDGGILVMVMVVLLAVSFMTVGFFRLQETDAVEAVYVEQSNQAFWLAETGMQQALDRLRKSKSFRDNPSELSATVGGGVFTAVVAKASNPDTWNIASKGTVNGISRLVTLDPLLTAEVGYALMGLDGNSRLDKTGDIEGNVYSYGNIDVNGRASPSINGEVLSLDADSQIDYTPLTENDRVEMKVDGPISDFASAVGSAPTTITVTQTIDGLVVIGDYIDLTGGKIVKVNGNYDFPASVRGTYGDGKLIVDGNLRFPNSGDPFFIGDSGNVYVDGDIWAGKDGTFGQDVVVYCTGDMSLQKAAGSGTTSLLIEGDLTVNKDLDFNGLIFADGSVTVDGNLTLDGALIAGEGFWLKRDYDVEFDGSQLSDDVMNNMILYVTYSAKPGTWNELPVS